MEYVTLNNRKAMYERNFPSSYDFTFSSRRHKTTSHRSKAEDVIHCFTVFNKALVTLVTVVVTIILALALLFAIASVKNQSKVTIGVTSTTDGQLQLMVDQGNTVKNLNVISKKLASNNSLPGITSLTVIMEVEDWMVSLQLKKKSTLKTSASSTANQADLKLQMLRSDFCEK